MVYLEDSAANGVVYSWNMIPIDGSDITRCFLVIGRFFPFSLDIAMQVDIKIPQDTEEAIYYLQVAQCTLKQQRQILNFLNENGREAQKALQYENVKIMEFKTGD